MDIDHTLFEGVRILYAEDDPVTRENITKTLRLFCSHVFSVEDGQAAVEVFEKEEPHVVILDYVMPRMNGLNAAKAMRALAPEIPIFMTSSYTDKEKLIGVMHLGLVDYLEKPLELFSLVKTLAKCLERLHEGLRLRVIFPSGVVYDGLRKEIGTKGVYATLTKKETQLLDFLLANHQRVVTQEEIEQKLYEGNVEANTVRNLVYRLRQKCGQEAIETAKGRGYSICAMPC